MFIEGYTNPKKPILVKYLEYTSIFLSIILIISGALFFLTDGQNLFKLFSKSNIDYLVVNEEVITSLQEKIPENIPYDNLKYTTIPSKKMNRVSWDTCLEKIIDLADRALIEKNLKKYFSQGCYLVYESVNTPLLAIEGTQDYVIYDFIGNKLDTSRISTPSSAELILLTHDFSRGIGLDKSDNNTQEDCLIIEDKNSNKLPYSMFYRRANCKIIQTDIRAKTLQDDCTKIIPSIVEKQELSFQGYMESYTKLGCFLVHGKEVDTSTVLSNGKILYMTPGILGADPLKNLIQREKTVFLDPINGFNILIGGFSQSLNNTDNISNEGCFIIKENNFSIYHTGTLREQLIYVRKCRIE